MAVSRCLRDLPSHGVPRRHHERDAGEDRRRLGGRDRPGDSHPRGLVRVRSLQLLRARAFVADARSPRRAVGRRAMDRSRRRGVRGLSRSISPGRLLLRGAASPSSGHAVAGRMHRICRGRVRASVERRLPRPVAAHAMARAAWRAGTGNAIRIQRCAGRDPSNILRRRRASGSAIRARAQRRRVWRDPGVLHACRVDCHR